MKMVDPFCFFINRFTQLAKLSIDRSADRLNSQLTYSVSFLIKY